jgi:hypothetical protein
MNRSSCRSLVFTAFAAIAAIAAFFAFAPGARAQVSDLCDDVCVPWGACSTSCQHCTHQGIDGCTSSRASTCGAEGVCGGCAVTNTYTEDQHYKYGPQDSGVLHCLYRDYFYPFYQNKSQYSRWQTEVRHVTFQTTTCSGVSTTQQVSATSDWGECYQFEYPACPDGVFVESQSVNGRECYW